MFDSHCHLQFNAYKDDREAVIERCLQKGAQCNIVGTQKDTSKTAVELAEKYNGFYATIGLHPTHLHPTQVDEEESSFLSREEEFDVEYYKNLAKSKKVVAIGECGIDLFHIPSKLDWKKVLEKQKQEFLKQIKLAQELDLALVVHVRNSGNPELPNAYDEVIKVFQDEARPHPNLPLKGEDANPLLLRRGSGEVSGMRVVIHCFAGTPTQAQEFTKLGCSLGFTGVITFPARKTNPKPTEDLLEVVKKCPLGRILIETDAPYLAPQAYRGQRCEPWMVEEVAKKIAELRGLETDEIIKITDDNSKHFFKI